MAICNVVVIVAAGSRGCGMIVAILYGVLSDLMVLKGPELNGCTPYEYVVCVTCRG